LGPKGAWRIASKLGSSLEYPDELTETWKRDLEKRIRCFGIRWLREPRWIQLKHDVEAIDFRLAIDRALSGIPNLKLEEWRLESYFRANYDTVEYRAVGRNGEIRRGRKGVQPDGYFVIVDKDRSTRGLQSKVRFLLEIDQGTADVDRLAEKFLAGGFPYIESAAFKERFGDNKADWLVSTTGTIRMTHLMERVLESVGPGAQMFSFTTTNLWKKRNILTSPIWRQPGVEQPFSLFPSNGNE
jgi:hypothetical protein